MSGSSGETSEVRFSGLGERVNIAEGGKRFRARFIEPGPVSYKDMGAGGVDLIRKETIDLCLESMKGAALTIDHPSTETILGGDFSDHSHGVVDKVEYDPASGWYVCEGSVETDEARKRIEAGDGISCGFTVTERANGGSWHRIPYTQEDTRIKFHHLAIVPPDKRARYEEAAIRLNSMKTPTFAAKLIQKLTGGSPREIAIDAKTSVNVDGEPVTFEQMIREKKEAALRSNSTYCCGPDDMIEHEGETHRCADLIASHKAMKNGGKMMEKPAEMAMTRENATETEVVSDGTLVVNGQKLPAGKYTIKSASNATETVEQRAERERQNAAAHIEQRIKEERAAAVAEDRASAERANAGRQSWDVLHTAADRRTAEQAAPNYDMGSSGSLDDGVALGTERYGKDPTGRRVATVNGKN